MLVQILEEAWFVPKVVRTVKPSKGAIWGRLHRNIDPTISRTNQ